MASQQKHLINSPETLVLDSLRGLCILNPEVALDERYRVVYRKNPSRDRVSIICGGGSGHEPAHAAFVGDGMLTAAVCGNIFASPNVSQITQGIKHVDTSKGTLIVVKNYTGDVLNFGLASEKHKASGAGGDVRVLIVGDDVTVGKTQGALVGRRGLAGTVLVNKVAGALARSGASLDEVEAAARLIADNMGTVGVGLEHCHVPGTDSGDSYLAVDEIELGMGIHNEPGFQRLQPLPSLSEAIGRMFSMLSSTTDPERSYLPFKGDGTDEVVLLVNNLGAMSELELSAILGQAVQWLRDNGYQVRRVLSGAFMTSLNMPGFSLTLLLLPRTGSGAPLTASEILSLLDEPVNVPGWRHHSRSGPGSLFESSMRLEDTTKAQEPVMSPGDLQGFVDAISRACEALIKAEPEITQQDVVAGDGDAGLTLKAGAEGVLAAIKSGGLPSDNAISAILAISEIVGERMGGTSGALYSIYFSGLAKGLRDAANSTSTASLEVWSKAAAEALTTLCKYTRARPPSRTLIDPLTAFVEKLPNGLSQAAEAAHAAAEATRNMTARAGRSAYVEQKRLAESNVPDPGAWGVAVLVRALAEGL